MKIDRINVSFFDQKLKVPFVFGNNQPIESLCICQVSLNDGAGISDTTLAHVWAKETLDNMKRSLAATLGCFLNKPFIDPFEIYHSSENDVRRVIKQISGGMTEAAIQIVRAAYDNAIWDMFSKSLGKHPCQCLSPNFGDILLSEPNPEVGIVYTHGGDGKLLSEDGLLGLLERCHNEDRQVVKVKCSKNLEKTFREISTLLHNLPQIKLWFDFNGDCESMDEVEKLLGAILSSDYESIIAIEQPIIPANTFLPANRPIKNGNIEYYLDESLLSPTDVSLAKEAEYDGVVVKLGKGGFSTVIETVSRARALGLNYTVQDLTNWGKAAGASIGAAAWLDIPFIELNGIQFYEDPGLDITIRDGVVDTGPFTEGPGWD